MVKDEHFHQELHEVVQNLTNTQAAGLFMKTEVKNIKQVVWRVNNPPKNAWLSYFTFQRVLLHFQFKQH